MQAVVGNIATLKRDRDAYDVAYRELSEQLKRGEVDTFKFVVVTRTDANGTTTVERFGDVCPKPPKKRAGDAAPPSSKTPYQTFRTVRRPCRVFSRPGRRGGVPRASGEAGGKSATNQLLPERDVLLLHAPAQQARAGQARGWHRGGNPAGLPGFNTFAKFVAEAKALLADGDGGVEEAGDGEGEEE